VRENQIHGLLPLPAKQGEGLRVRGSSILPLPSHGLAFELLTPALSSFSGEREF